jgi:L-amino acid N-acyltransferase YncA
MLQSGFFRKYCQYKVHEKLGFRTVGHRKNRANERVWRDIILMERRSKRYKFHKKIG